MDITHIFWDWNGTLLNDMDLCIESINYLLNRYKKKNINKTEYRNKFCFPITKYYENVGFDLYQYEFNKLSTEYIEYYQPKSNTCSLISNAKSTLQKIHDLKISQIILSVSKRDLLINQVQYFGIEYFFEDILGLDNIYAKSKKEIAKKWVENNKINPNNILVIGDTYHDFELAKFIGSKFLYYKNGHQDLSKNEEISIESTIYDIKEVLEKLSFR